MTTEPAPSRCRAAGSQLPLPVVLTFLMVGLGSAAQSQELPSTPPVMTLTEALAYSRAHQPELRQAQAEVAAREAEAQVPRAGWLPRVSMQAQWLVGTTNNTTTSFFNVRGADVPRVSSTPVTTTTSWTPSPSSIVAANVNQQIFDFGRIAAQAAVADARTDVARAGAATVQLDTELNVEEAFNAVLAAKHILSATQEAYKRAEAHSRLAETGVRSGMRPPIDRTRAQADLAQADVQRTRAEAGLTTAQAGLAAAVGSSELMLDAAERQPSDRPFPGLTEALRLADQNSPEVMAALARLRAGAAETSALTRELLPNLYFSGSVWGNAGGGQVASAALPVGSGWLPSVGNYSLSVILEWHLLDPVMLARRRASRRHEQVEQAAIDVTRRAIILTVQRSYLDAVAAQKTLPGLLARVTASKANLEQAEARFRAGLGNIVELTDAEALLVTSQLELAVGQFNVARAASHLARALGTAAKN